MTYATSDSVKSLAQEIYKLDPDEQLALLWLVYTGMGESITPAAPGASTASPEIAESLFTQVEQLPHEEQLQLQRDLVAGHDTPICREYGALSDTTKLLFWYHLAQGMDKGSVIPMPEDYQTSDQIEDLFEQIKALDFNQQITLLRQVVSPMGFDSTAT